MSINYGYPPIVTNGLVLHLDAANPKSYVSGSTSWNDLSGYRNVGTLTNGPTYSSANFGSIVFDGVDDYVDFGNSLANDYSQITLSTWVRPTTKPNTSSSFEFIIGSDDNSSSGLESVFNLCINHQNNPTSLPASFKGNLITFGVRSASQIQRTRPIVIPDLSVYQDYLLGMAITVDPLEYQINTWMNLTGTYNGSQTILYINGIFKATSASQPDGINRSVSGIMNTSTISRRIATSSSGTSQFTGNIASTQIYNRALSADEVLQNYNALKQRYI